MTTFLKANWQNIIMANYAIPQNVLKPFLPKGVELDLYNDKAYVSLVGFMFKKTELFNVSIPFLGNFEEVNLRFYVKRIVNNEIRRGVVFINETVPYKAVAWLANKLYKEHYTAIPTKHTWNISADTKEITYKWLVNKKWNSLYVNTINKKLVIQPNSFEEFIFEHYFGYTKLNSNLTLEYGLQHPTWNVNEILNYKIDCDFEANYGKCFSILNNINPDSVFIAEGSPVSIDWKRHKI